MSVLIYEVGNFGFFQMEVQHDQGGPELIQISYLVDDHDALSETVVIDERFFDSNAFFKDLLADFLLDLLRIETEG